MRRATIAVALSAGLLACATDPRLEGPWAARPIVAPADTGAFTLGGGVRTRGRDLEPAFALALEVGVTDGLSLAFPLVARVGGALDDEWSLALSAGLLGATLNTSSVLLETPTDPRRPVPAVLLSTLTFGGGPALQWRPSSDVTLSLSAQAGASFFGVEHVSLRVHTGGSVTKSFGRWVSATLGAAYDLEGAPTAAGEVYGQRFTGVGGLGLHFDGFDVGLFVDLPLAPTILGPDVVLAWTYLF